MNQVFLGRTSLQVSQVALGCEGFASKSVETCRKMINEAMAHGINFIDMYASDPTLRSHLGVALEGRRDQWVIEGHIGSAWKNDQYLRTRNVKEAKKSFEDLLVRLKTDYIDVGMIHYVDAWKDYEDVFQGPFLEYVLELKKQGKIHHVGLSSHNPEVALAAVKTGLIDVLLFSVNPCYDMLPPSEDVDDLWKEENYASPLVNMDPARKALYEYCEKENIAITVMKAFGGGDLLDEKLSPFGVKMSVIQCIHYALTRPGVISVMAGAHSIEEIQQIAFYDEADMQVKDYALVLSHVPKHQLIGHCVYCGHCAPCPKGIDIAKVHQFLDLCVAQGEVVETAREHYLALKHHANECIACGSCMKNCPFGVDVISKMKQAVTLFKI